MFPNQGSNHQPAIFSSESAETGADFVKDSHFGTIVTFDYTAVNSDGLRRHIRPNSHLVHFSCGGMQVLYEEFLAEEPSFLPPSKEPCQYSGTTNNFTVSSLNRYSKDLYFFE